MGFVIFLSEKKTKNWLNYIIKWECGKRAGIRASTWRARMAATYGDRKAQGDCQQATTQMVWRYTWGAKGAVLWFRTGAGAETDEYAEEEALDEALAKQLVEEEMEMDTDTSKNNGTDKNAKDSAQERRSEDI